MKSRLQRSSTALLVAMLGLSLVFGAGCTRGKKKSKEATELPSESKDSKPTETSGLDSAPSGDAIDGKGSSDLASDKPRTDDTFAAADSGSLTPAGAGNTGGSFEGLESRHGSAAIGEPHGDAGLTPAAPAPVEEEIAQAQPVKKKKKKKKKAKKADLEAPIETADADPAAAGDDHDGSGGYTVKKGDVMSRIAKQHGVSLKALISANKMTPDQASKIKVGQKLKIPAGAGKAD